MTQMQMKISASPRLCEKKSIFRILCAILCALCVETACADVAAAVATSATLPREGQRPRCPSSVESQRPDTDATIASRVVEWEGVSNARDLGGLPGLGGRMVRTGRIYRSAGLNKNAHFKGKDGKRLPRSEWKGPGETLVTPEAARHIVGTLGVKIDLDLRNDAETFGMEASPLGADVRWILLPSSDYGKLAGERGRKAFAKGFRLFLDEGNYPILFHCKGGADRTGTLACILNGLLGVEEDLLYSDWRFTWTDSFKKPVPEEAWGRLMAVFAEYEGETLNERIEKFVLSCGIAQGEIETFRSMMLEETP